MRYAKNIQKTTTKNSTYICYYIRVYNIIQIKFQFIVCDIYCIYAAAAIVAVLSIFSMLPNNLHALDSLLQIRLLDDISESIWTGWVFLYFFYFNYFTRPFNITHVLTDAKTSDRPSSFTPPALFSQSRPKTAYQKRIRK